MLSPNDGVIIRLASERSEAVDAAIGFHETRPVIWHDHGAICWAAASQATSATRSCARQSQPVGLAEEESLEALLLPSESVRLLLPIVL
jgi:hypothetical protein